MKRTIVTLAVVTAVVAAASAQQPPPMPKPGAEQANLAKFAGTWKMEGKMESGPMGPGGPMTGTETCRMFDGGWHLVCESSGTSPMGPMKGIAIMTYDSAAKQYRHFGLNSVMPDAEMAIGTKKGNSWTWTSKSDMGGKTIHSRFLITEKSATVYTYVWEMSEDGQKWMKAMEGTSTKTGS